MLSQRVKMLTPHLDNLPHDTEFLQLVATCTRITLSLVYTIQSLNHSSSTETQFDVLWNCLLMRL